jgi:hypothetical protein
LGGISFAQGLLELRRVSGHNGLHTDKDLAWADRIGLNVPNAGTA